MWTVVCATDSELQFFEKDCKEDVVALVTSLMEENNRGLTEDNIAVFEGKRIPLKVSMEVKF